MPLFHQATPEEEKQLCFEVWFLEAGRSPKATAEILKREHEIEIRANTISEWTRRENWHNRANDMLFSVAPGMKTEMLANLLVAGVKASRLIVKLTDDASNNIRVDGAAAKLSVETMHMAGFSPMGHRNPLESQRSNVIERSKLLELYGSDEEIALLMARQMLKSGDGSNTDED